MTDKKTILIVEDEAFLSEMYQTKFESLGYKVITATTGEEGLQLMRSEHPALVLLDVIMPVMDGYEVLRRVRNDKDVKNQLIIIFSNLGQDEEVTKGMQMGADDYLIKSNLTPSQLVKKVEAVLARGRLSDDQPIDINVLLICDDQKFIDQYQERFEKESFKSRVVENVNYGIKVAQSEPYDVIVYDGTTGDSSVVDTVSTLHQTPKLWDIPIVVLSDDTSDGMVENLKNAGAETVYLKPRVTITQLVNHIRELINQKK